MIVEIREFWKQTVRGLKTCREFVCSCDACGKELIRDRHAKQVAHHYCDRTCLKKGFSRNGITGTTIAATNIEKYGCENVFAASEIKNKIQETCVERYGVKHAPSSSIVKTKIRKTVRERYGCDAFLSLPEARLKGVAKAATPEVRAAIDWQSLVAKQHATKKANGTFLRSKIEDRFFEHLIDRFGEVKRAVMVNGWEIDFYIPSIDTYVQFDGVYWHGLDRSIEVIREFKSPRDKVIYGTFCRDREQDEWFATNHLRLLRVTDLQFKRGDHVSFT